jgi:hypothetical protein
MYRGNEGNLNKKKKKKKFSNQILNFFPLKNRNHLAGLFVPAPCMKQIPDALVKGPTELLVTSFCCFLSFVDPNDERWPIIK